MMSLFFSKICSLVGQQQPPIARPPIRISIAGIVLLVLIEFQSADIVARDFHSALERPVDGTAYTPEAKQKRLTAGIFGTQYADILLSLGISFAPTKFFNLGINLAHLGVGILNLHTKFNFLDRKWYGLGLRIDFVWAHGKWLWVVPDSQKAYVNDIDAFVIPVHLTASMDPTHWLHFDLSAIYEDVEIIGGSANERLFYDGYLGARQVAIKPTVRFYLLDKLSLNVSGKLPVWGQTKGQLATHIELSPGVRGGIRSVGYKNFKPLYYWLVTVRSETEITTRLFLGINLGVGSYIKKIYERSVNAGLDLEWRF